MKIAVVGTGSAGTHHINALSKLPGIQPIAVSQRLARLKQLESLGVEAAPDIQASIFKGAQAAIIANDTGRHATDAITALNAGLDVLVEKPLAVDQTEAREICDAASVAMRQLYVGCVLRFSRSLNTFRARIGEAGRLHSVRIEGRSYLPDWSRSRPYQESYSARSADGGILRDHIHEVDYAGWIFGWPYAVFGSLRNVGRLEIDSDESAELMWETPTGCAVSVSVDYLTRPPSRRIVACGDSGTIAWDGINGILNLFKAGAGTETIADPQSLQDMFEAQAQAFVESLNEIYTDRLATGDDGSKAVSVCDAVRLASESKRETVVVYD